MTAQPNQIKFLGTLTKLNRTTVLALLVGLAPLFGGILFQTYQFHVEPSWYESLRQFDMPYILIEFCVVLWAHEKGLNFKEFFKNLDRYYQIATLLFFATFAVGSFVNSPVPGYSLLRASFWIIHIGFAISVYHLLKYAPTKAVPKMTDAMILGLAIFVPLLVGHFALAPNPAETKLGQIIWSSAVPGCLSVRHFGIWVGASLAMWLGRNSWLQKSGSISWSYWAITAALIGLMTWSGTRAAVAGVVASIVVVSIFMQRLPNIGNLTMLAGATILGLIMSAMAFQPDASFGVLNYERMFGSATADINEIGSGRLEIWAAVLRKFVEKPIFGWGEGAMFWNVNLQMGRHLQPHNSAVQMLFSWGIVATTAAAFVMFRALWTLHTNVRHVPTMLPPLMLVDCTLLMSVFDGALYFSRMIMPGAMAIALCFALMHTNANDQQASSTT
jgi:exopolysaccharide production protein ExoQ